VSGDPAGQAKLVGDPATDPVRVHVSRQLRLHLRLCEADRFGHLHRSSGGLDFLQPRNPINPHSIRHLACVRPTRTLSDTLSQAG
jgi:hypothetical protein